MPVITRTAKTNVLLPDHQKIKEGQRAACSIIEANTDVSSTLCKLVLCFSCLNAGRQEKYFGKNALDADPSRHATGILGLEEVGYVWIGTLMSSPN